MSKVLGVRADGQVIDLDQLSGDRHGWRPANVCFAEFKARQVAGSEDEADRLIKTGAPIAVIDGSSWRGVTRSGCAGSRLDAGGSQGDSRRRSPAGARELIRSTVFA